MNNWWYRQSVRFYCKLHYFFPEIDMVLLQFCNILPAVGMLVCVSVCPFPSAPAASATVGALLSAYSAHPAGRIETQPGCGHQPASLHHCWALLKHTTEQNLSYTVFTFTNSCLADELLCLLQCLCVILMNIKYALKASFTHHRVSMQGR